jgi:hypothetical protein
MRAIQVCRHDLDVSGAAEMLRERGLGSHMEDAPSAAIQ